MGQSWLNSGKENSVYIGIHLLCDLKHIGLVINVKLTETSDNPARFTLIAGLGERCHFRKQ